MKTTTILKVFMVAAVLLGAATANAQIQDLDESKYYMIRLSEEREANEAKFAVGVSFALSTLDDVLLEQQTPDELDTHLWKISEVETGVYRLYNKASGKAMGISTARPASGLYGENTEPSSFSWDGVWPGFALRDVDQSSDKQLWSFPLRGQKGDTTFYNLTSLAAEYGDSLFSLNVWAHQYGHGFENIVLFGVGHHAQLGNYEGDGPSNYHVFLTKTSFEVTSVKPQNLSQNIRMIPIDGGISLRGEIQGRTIEVYSVIGSLVHQTKATSSEININLRQGVYIVKVGNVVNKVLVR